MSTDQKLAEAWKRAGIKLTSIPIGTIFYSGIRAKTRILDPLEYFSAKHSIWLSQSAYWAGEYCYRESDANSYKLLIKVTLACDIDVIEFPPDFHPADAFFYWEIKNDRFHVDYAKPNSGMRFDEAQPDHHIDKNFLDIARLAGYQSNIHGYIRRAENTKLGANPGEIIELSLIAQDALCLQDTFIPPKHKDGFLACIGDDKSLASIALFHHA